MADLCTGSGVAAIGAARQGASDVMAFDISAAAVRCARRNALAAGVDVDVHLGSWSRAIEFGPFELVVCNPPYVPQPSRTMPSGDRRRPVPLRRSTPVVDGRLVLDPLCAAAPDLLADGGTLLIVHSEFSGRRLVPRRIAQRWPEGVDVIARQWVPFGPVLTARAGWLQRIGLLERRQATRGIGRHPSGRAMTTEPGASCGSCQADR